MLKENSQGYLDEEEMIKKKKDESKWLRELSSEKFQEVFIEWYLPAIKSKLLGLEDRIKKLEEKK